MFTDIKDYSKLMSVNEDLAIKLLGIHDSIVIEKISAIKNKLLRKLIMQFK